MKFTVEVIVAEREAAVGEVITTRARLPQHPSHLPFDEGLGAIRALPGHEGDSLLQPPAQRPYVELRVRRPGQPKKVAGTFVRRERRARGATP